MTEENKTVINNINLSWKWFWVAGWLFTVGFVGFSPTLGNETFWTKSVVYVVSYLFWPMILGLHLGGGAWVGLIK